jgi:1,4-alpha-glucan branching enzyme
MMFKKQSDENRRLLMTNKKCPGEMTKEQIYLFHQGTNCKSYHMLGSHPYVHDNQKGVKFAVWAPEACWVSVVGNFNGWNVRHTPMVRANDTGIWEATIPDLAVGELYKYAIGSKSGEVLYKYDPYAYYAEVRPGTASIVWDIEGYSWGDMNWERNKREHMPYNKPMLIYEVHLGSWNRKDDGSFLSYREIAHQLSEYVIYMGYTHIELLPVMEHPYDGSWGYQVLGYYAVTSRYGTPQDFMYFVDVFHQKGIGVILDWVPAHFPKDAHGLAKFDGSSLYEHADPRKSEHPQWGTLIYNYARQEVQSFLISNAVFWLEYYHVDGFRVDAVTSMLYLDYAREEWIPNCFGGRENLEAADFLKRLNETVFSLYPGILMIAEDSSQWPLVTTPTSNGGLGFNYKWNMGWMNDTLKYFSLDPYFRKWNHDLLTFSLHYAFSENFILPLSHDEVVHGKHSLLDKMPGDYNQKFSGLRILFAYMIAHPGKKLTFMGGEFGHFIEWKFDDKLDWHLLGYEMHQKMREYVRELNYFYRDNPCLWEDDNGWSGFRWIEANDKDMSVISLLRMGRTPDEFILVVINFTPVLRQQYRIGIPYAIGYQEIFNSNEQKYGGSGALENEIIAVETIPLHQYEQSISLYIPPLSAVFYKPVQLSKIQE